MKRYDENPMYIQLYKRILKNIETKKYSYSEKLPSENQFAKEFGVNRHTIRQSLELLKNEGLIYTKIGVGNFISNIKVPYSISDKSSYTSKILDLGYEPKTELLNIDIIQSNEQIASNLGLKTGLKVIELKLLRYANDIPISVSYSYFDAYIYRELINNLKCNPFSLYKALDIAYPHLEITKQSTVFEAVMSTQQLSELLMMPLNSPILTASTISKDQNGNFVEYGISYFRGDTCKIKVDLV